MLTKEFTGLISEAAGLSKKETEQLLSTMNALIRENVMAGNTVQLQSIGTLEIKTRNERAIVHPKTGERSIVPGRNGLSGSLQMVYRLVGIL